MDPQMPGKWSNFTYNSTAPNIDIELLQKEVGKHFPFYDVKYNIQTIAFFCRIDEETLEEKFELLRQSLSTKGFIPMIRFEKGEHIIYVIRKPPSKKKPLWINLALLVATIFTTTLAGSIQWMGMDNASLIDIFTPSYLWNGFLFFSIPLMSILGIHEMGHYFISKRHKVDASLPYFIPLPPPFILGTLGALISTREPIPNRKALLDIGVSGPLCGFLVAIPVSFLGFFFMQQNPMVMPAESEGFTIVFPLLLQWISSFFVIPENLIIHPTLFAGWVGIFLTAVNLLPAGQLDGGHIARALLKDKHKYASWAVIILLFALGLYYAGWLFFAFIILFMIGTHHQPPLNEIDPLGTKRQVIGVVALLIFLLSFAPIPISI
jgi:membrane-associated protease RseP (regulator of RpoE activity)